MIGSHNTLTYYNPQKRFFKLFAWLWRCQDSQLSEQLSRVDYFDIRVRYKKGRLIFCHGLVDLDVPYSLADLLYCLSLHNKTCRVILERGEDLGLMNELETYLGHTVVHVVIKKGWKILYGTPPACKDYTYIPFYSDKSFWENLKHLKISTPKRWAKKHNPQITQEIINDDVIHFMDFV